VSDEAIDWREEHDKLYEAFAFATDERNRLLMEVRLLWARCAALQEDVDAMTERATRAENALADYEGRMHAMQENAAESIGRALAEMEYGEITESLRRMIVGLVMYEMWAAFSKGD